MTGSQALNKRVARLIACIYLLFLLSVCRIGCGIGRPPVMTLEQWQAEDDSVRSGGDYGHKEPRVIGPTWRRGTTLVSHPGVLNAMGSYGRHEPTLMTAC
jgi:hypothetical protein